METMKMTKTMVMDALKVAGYTVMAVLAVAFVVYGSMDTEGKVVTVRSSEYVHVHSVYDVTEVEGTTTVAGYVEELDNDKWIHVPCTIKTDGHSIKMTFGGVTYTGTFTQIDTAEHWICVDQLTPMHTQTKTTTHTATTHTTDTASQSKADADFDANNMEDRIDTAEQAQAETLHN